MQSVDALVIGAGPAGLMAAQVLAEAGRRVTIIEAKPSPARKLLMAGKSGLNLSKDEEFERFVANFDEAADFLRPMLRAFDPQAVQLWARGLGQEVFIGSSGRVFPTAMKASPLLRAWLTQLTTHGVDLRRNWRWQGFDQQSFLFATPDGERKLQPAVTVLALGGASWSRLGSDGHWAAHLRDKGVSLTPFAPANAGLMVEWSPYMRTHFGAPIKSIRVSAGATRSRGELVISAKGLEGSGIYSLSKAIRHGHKLQLDLYPDSTVEKLQQKLQRSRGKASLSNYLRKAIGLQGAKMALVRETCPSLPSGGELAFLLKNLGLRHSGLTDIDQAISTAGGVGLDAVDDKLMLRALAGVFCAGEMLDWEAPTGGYLISGCLATGCWAGRAAARYAAN